MIFYFKFIFVLFVALDILNNKIIVILSAWRQRKIKIVTLKHDDLFHDSSKQKRNELNSQIKRIFFKKKFN